MYIPIIVFKNRINYVTSVLSIKLEIKGKKQIIWSMCQHGLEFSLNHSLECITTCKGGYRGGVPLHPPEILRKNMIPIC